MRTIPYGYRMKNGNIIIEPEESEIVKYIFKEYIGGLSYKKLADKLNAKGIIYSEGCEIWKLGTVKKLIAREHYIGKNAYPRIISDEEYYTAQRLSKERRRAIGGPTADLAAMKKITICGECGHRLERFGSRYKGVSRFYWRCINDDCTKLGFSITDDMMTYALDRTIISSEHKIVQNIGYEPNSKIIYQQNQINQMLDSDKADYDRIKEEIVKLASLKYESIVYKCSDKQAERITDLIANYESDIEKRAEFIRECVSRIIINNKHEFIVELIDGTALKSYIERTKKNE
ncbi:recombinase family protein [Ruminococcus sp. YE78]|nr:recombinase family protein [Ruminococcus sp. YE78]